MQQIEAIIATYDKPAIIRFIVKQTSRQITLYVGNAFRPFYGIPDPVYVTPHTIRIDLLGGGMVILNSSYRSHRRTHNDNVWITEL